MRRLVLKIEGNEREKEKVDNMEKKNIQIEFEKETGWRISKDCTCAKNVNLAEWIDVSYYYKAYAEWLENKMSNCRKDVLYENVDKLRNMKLDVSDKYKAIVNSILSTAANMLLDSE